MNIEVIIQNLLTGSKKDQAEALNILCNLSSPQQINPIEERVELLKHCNTVPRDLLTIIIISNIFTPTEELREVCIELLKNHLNRPGRQKVLEKLLDGSDDDRALAIQLGHEWGVQTYGDMLLPLLEDSDSNIVQSTIRTLSHISITTYIKSLMPLFQSEDDEIRFCLAEEISQHRQTNIPKSAIEACLKDKLSSVRLMGLSAIKGGDPKAWISHLSAHLERELDADEMGESVKLLGETHSAKAIPALLELLLRTADQGVRWACIQSLDQIDEKQRLRAYKELLKNCDPEQKPLIYELAGYCHSREGLLFLRKTLESEEDSGLRSLIASAIGSCGHPEGESDLLKLMEGNVGEAYAASAALKSVVKGRMMDHFESFLSRTDIDPLIKQVLIQHISENARVVKVGDSLRKRIEFMLSHENENIRYLSLIAVGEIASTDSLPILIELTNQTWTRNFQSELHTSIEACCRGTITPLLQLISNAPDDQRELLRTFLIDHPMALNEKDLAYLSDHESFSHWNWDEELLPCIHKTQEVDRTFIWKQFSRKDLSNKLCCFLARGYDLSQPQAKELLDPSILIQCFARFEAEKPLLLLGKLMSNFPRVELLLPLIQYSENADPELRPIFKSYVRKIIHGMGTEGHF